MAVTLFATAPLPARAGGFEIPDHGARSVGRAGAYAVGAADLTAMHYNPGALARLDGTRVLYHHNLVFHRSSFERATLGDPWGSDSGTSFARVEDGRSLFPLGIFGVVASDFGLDDWMFAAGVYGPSAVGRHDYPSYGPQSFMVTKMDVVIPQYSLAAAWQRPERFGVGVTLQYVDVVKLDYGLVADSAVAPGLNPVPDSESPQLVTELQLRDRTAFTALVGVWGRPHRALELGLAGRVVPVFLEPQGGVSTDKETVVTEQLHAKMPVTLPVQLRGGLRYLHRRGQRLLFDVELDVFWENWSVIDAFEIALDGRINGQELQDLTIDKRWKDTVSIRLGGDLHVIPDSVSVRAGALWESAAVPDGYSHLDFPSFMRGGLSAGISAGLRGVALTVGYMHLFQEDRDVAEDDARVYQQRPVRPCPDSCNGAPGVPANAGRFRTSYDILSLGLDVKLGP